MDTPKKFEILIRRKVPYLSSFLIGVAFFLCVILFIVYLIMLPTKYASGEMATAYYILVIPEWLKTLSAYSIIALPIAFWLYYNMRLYKPAILTINDKELAIIGKNINLLVPFRKIEKVYCKGFVTLSTDRKRTLKIVLQQKQHKSTTFKLKHPELSEEVLDAFGSLKNADFIFTNDTLAGDTFME
jgi:hypothetical protein